MSEIASPKTITWRLPVGTGKAGVELYRLTRGKQPKPQKPSKTSEHFFVFDRDEIEKRDHRRFLNEFGLHIEYGRLKHLHQRISFVVAGYDREKEELFEIQEVRDYLFWLQLFWPAWTYCGSLRNDCLRMIACCIVKNVRAQRRADESHVSVLLNHESVQEFFDKCLPISAGMHGKAGICLHRGIQHLKKTARYLGLDES